MAPRRLPHDQARRTAYLREHGAAGFVDAVADARRDSIDVIITTVSGFADEPEVLYVALEFAADSGIAVTVAPPLRQRGLASVQESE
jgi:hypothetical protein